MAKVAHRPSRVNDIKDVNRELMRIYDLLNELISSVNTFDETKSRIGKAGNMRISRNRSGNVVLEIRANDDWYTSSEIFTKL